MTPALWARLFVAATAELVRGFRLSGNLVGRSVEIGSAGLLVDAAGDCKGFVATVGLVEEATSSCVSLSDTSSDSEYLMASFCLLERWLANPAVLLSMAVSEELLRSPSSSLTFVSRNALCSRNAMPFSKTVKIVNNCCC